MSLPELVTIHTSLLTDLGDAVRSRFGVSGDLTLDEMAETIFGLPNTYQAVEYIESSGTQYINTGFTPTADFEFDIDLEMPPVTAQSDFYIFGSSYTQSSNMSYSFGGYNSLYHAEYGSQTAHFFESASFSGKAHINYHNGIVSITDGTTTLSADLSAQTHYTSTTPFYIFANNNTTISGGQGKASYKLYQCIIKSGGAIIRNFIPCYRKSDNEIGMYDIINNQFYTNAGTGSFITP